MNGGQSLTYSSFFSVVHSIWDGTVNKEDQEAFAQWQWVRFNCHLFSLNYVEIIEHHVVFAANIRNSWVMRFARKLNDLWERNTIINLKIPCFQIRHYHWKNSTIFSHNFTATVLTSHDDLFAHLKRVNLVSTDF